MSFENTVGKGEIARNEQFLLSHSVFYLVIELSVVFIKFKIVVCKLFPFGRVWNLSFGKGLNLQILFKISPRPTGHTIKAASCLKE